ncbi:MAG: RNA polymerase sigma factor [Planctomycetota bacterium]
MEPTIDPAPFSRSRFDLLVAPHVDALHARARNILGSDDLAWDAVQETLLRAWTWDTLPSEPRAVLLDLVRRSSLHILRCTRRRDGHEARAAGDRPHCCSDDPLNAVADGETRDRIQRAIASLTEEYRSVVELVGVEGETYRRAAERLGIPVGTVRSRASRARERLREVVGGEAEVA